MPLPLLLGMALKTVAASLAQGAAQSLVESMRSAPGSQQEEEMDRAANAFMGLGELLQTGQDMISPDTKKKLQEKLDIVNANLQDRVDTVGRLREKLKAERRGPDDE